VGRVGQEIGFGLAANTGKIDKISSLLTFQAGLGGRFKVNG